MEARHLDFGGAAECAGREIDVLAHFLEQCGAVTTSNSADFTSSSDRPLEEKSFP